MSSTPSASPSPSSTTTTTTTTINTIATNANGDTYIPVGQFNVATSTLLVVDPCHDKEYMNEGDLALKLPNVHQGKWRCVVKKNEECGDRIWELIAFSTDTNMVSEEIKESILDNDI